MRLVRLEIVVCSLGLFLMGWLVCCLMLLANSFIFLKFTFASKKPYDFDFSFLFIVFSMFSISYFKVLLLSGYLKCLVLIGDGNSLVVCIQISFGINWGLRSDKIFMWSVSSKKLLYTVSIISYTLPNDSKQPFLSIMILW